MEAASWILLALAVLGGADVLFYHSISHNLRRHPPACVELWSHAARGPIYAALFVLVPNVELHGAWYALLLLLLGLDLAVSVWDFLVERESRRELGGLSSGEYLLHVAMAILFGALLAMVLQASRSWPTLPTELVWAPAHVPLWLRAALGCIAPAVLLSGLLDLFAARRLSEQRRQQSAR